MSRKILLIGGPARVGKSTLARAMRPFIDGQIVSGDAFTHAIRDTTTAAQLPELHPAKLSITHGTAEQWLARIRQRDAAIWPFYHHYIDAATHETTDDILLDGNFWPDYITSLTSEHRAVFLVDTSSDRTDFLKSIRDNDTLENNWMRHRGYDDAYIERWASYDRERQYKIIELCKAHGYPYFDNAEYGIAESQERAKAYLLQ